MASMTAVGSDETSDVLTHPYRRYVLHYLRTHSKVVAIDTLTALLANELEGPSATAGRETPEQIELALQQTHLPKLADAGLITYEDNLGEIALADDTDATGLPGVTPLAEYPPNSAMATQMDTRPEGSVPSIATLFCPTCGHQSHVNGDWHIVRTAWTSRYLCPTCHTELTVRPTDALLESSTSGVLASERGVSRSTQQPVRSPLHSD